MCVSVCTLLACVHVCFGVACTEAAFCFAKYSDMKLEVPEAPKEKFGSWPKEAGHCMCVGGFVKIA